MKFVAIIPARYSSTRFPGKPLADLGGMTVIERVYRQASKVLDDVYVATDDERIYNAVNEFGGRAVMTSPDHRSGTDRLYEAATKLGLDDAVIINIQGDEPFVAPEQISQLMDCFNTTPGLQLATLVRPFPATGTFDELSNPNMPKVVIDDRSCAVYFSRSVIPYLRGVEKECWPSRHQYYSHIGMYAYTVSALATVTALPPSSLEIAESLEQLRWIQNGMKVKVAVSYKPTIGIDTPEDLERARQFLARL